MNNIKKTDTSSKKDTRIIVLSYTVPHRKTYDMLCRLKAKGYTDVTVYAKPYHYKKVFKPLIEHRPENYGLDTEEVCHNLGYGYIECAGDIPLFGRDAVVLIAGAGIIPDHVIKGNTIINAHPGYIPDVRGLDALKWAIIEDKPIGCTTHLLGDEVDAGLIIERKEVPVYEGDSFHAVANRVYEYEVAMLIDAVEKVHDATEYIPGGENVVHKRMPHELELQLFQKFEERKRGSKRF